jgi:hypothetical protein
MTSEFHYFELTEIARRIHARKIPPVEATKTQLDRIEAVDPKLHSYALVTPEGGDQEPAARRADRGEGSVLDQGCRHDRRHDDIQVLPARLRRHGGPQAARCRRDHPGKAEDHRGRLRRSPPEGSGTAQPVECGALGRRILLWLGCRHGGGPLLRLARHRHRRVDPLPVGRQRPDRHQADLGPLLLCSPKPKSGHEGVGSSSALSHPAADLLPGGVGGRTKRR